MLSLKTWRAQLDERLPIYEQIVQRFCRSMASGEIGAGERIPSIRETALELGVNANTVQRAYQELERAGLIYTRRGMGYFTKEDASMSERVRGEMVRQAIARFMDEMRSLGFEDRCILGELELYLNTQQVKGDRIDGTSAD